MHAIDLIKSCEFHALANGGARVVLSKDVPREDYLKYKNIVEYAGGIYKSRSLGHSFKSSIETTREALLTCAKSVDEGRKVNAVDYFPTPGGLADELVDSLFAWDRLLSHRIDIPTAPPLRVLEPSAGDGSLVDAFFRYLAKHDQQSSVHITMIEYDSLRAELLRGKYDKDSTWKDRGVTFTIIEGDFTKHDAESLGGDFDVVIMNPPFKHWVQHLDHANSLLKSDGCGAFVLPSMKAIMTKRGKEGTKACDLISLNAISKVELTEIPAGRFLSHVEQRGAVVKTSVATSTLVASKDDKIDEEEPLEHFSLVACNTREVYDSIRNIGSTFGNISDNNTLENLISSITSYIDSNKVGMVRDHEIPIISSIPTKTYAMVIAMPVLEDFITDEMYDTMHHSVHGKPVMPVGNIPRIVPLFSD